MWTGVFHISALEKSSCSCTRSSDTFEPNSGAESCVTRRAESFCEHLWTINAVWKCVGLYDFCQTCGEFWLPGELPVRQGAEPGRAESRCAGISAAASLSAYLLRGRRAAEGSRRARQPPEDPWQSTSTPRTRHEGWLDVRRTPFGLRWPIAVRAVTL